MLALSVAVFAALALDLVLGGPVSSFDRAASDWLRGFAGPATMRAMALVSALHAPRPDFGGVGHAAGDFAFPSGHVANSALFYGSIALLLFHHLDCRAARRGVVGAAVALVVLVGVSRIVLGAHYPGDVVAAMAEALAWLALCAMATGMARRSQPVCRRAGDYR